MNRRSTIAALLLLCLSIAPAVQAERIRVAVAANFAGAAQHVADAFEQATGHTVELVAGSTGKHYAQIVNGAPFDLLLAADRARPERLEQDGHAVPGSRVTYALGRLVLWSPDAERVDAAGEVLRRGAFRHLALANPRLAPYGEAARETLEHVGLWTALQGRLVYGENVGQAFGFVASGAAELGFVALAQVRQYGAAHGSAWIVPASFHEPIEQQAILLRNAPAAAEFLAFLTGDAGARIVAAQGYGVPDVH